MKRVATTLVGIPCLVYFIRFTPDAVCTAIILIAMLLALREYLLLTSQNSFPIAVYVTAAAVLLSFYFENQILIFILPVAAALLLLLALFSKRDLGDAFRSAVFSLFGVAYVGGLMGYLVGVRRIEQSGAGRDLLMMLFVIIWANDIFAYVFGKAIGRHKLAPVVSPQKTVEGAIAGFLFGIPAAWLYQHFFLSWMGAFHAIMLGTLVGITGQLGDLCESLVKRAANVKDSGSILPGHGGMLDRVDSLLFGAPAMYYYFYLVLQK